MDNEHDEAEAAKAEYYRLQEALGKAETQEELNKAAEEAIHSTYWTTGVAATLATTMLRDVQPMDRDSPTAEANHPIIGALLINGDRHTMRLDLGGLLKESGLLPRNEGIIHADSEGVLAAADGRDPAFASALYYLGGKVGEMLGGRTILGFAVGAHSVWGADADPVTGPAAYSIQVATPYRSCHVAHKFIPALNRYWSPSDPDDGEQNMSMVFHEGDAIQQETALAYHLARGYADVEKKDEDEKEALRGAVDDFFRRS